MRLLLVFPFIPYPPDNGGRIGFWNPIKYLSRKHEVHIAFLAEKNDREHWEALRRHCASVQALAGIRSTGLISMARSLVGYPPGTARKYWDPRFSAVLQKAIKQQNIELVEFHHLNTAAYRDAAGALPCVLREHNIEHVIWERHGREAPLGERIYARWAAPRIKRYEREAAVRFDRCVVVSKADAAHLRRTSPAAHIEVIPSGVDTEYFCPGAESSEKTDEMGMVYVGAFYWRPRQHNLRVILEEIMPRIRARVPNARLCVVGKGIPTHLERLASRTPGVSLTGAVPDVRPYIRGASLVLNYVESGGGIALKVLEALAMRKAVLSNQLGCEGIDAEHGLEVFLADGVDNFADAAALLLGDAGLRKRLAEAGRDLVLREYSWNVLAGQFDVLYRALKEEMEQRSVRPLAAEESGSVFSRGETGYK
jgi:glycosyltransferase involved in cell wall biosynthesis